MQFTHFFRCTGLAGLLLAGLLNAASAAGPKAYVGNFKDNTVSVLDVAEGTVIATVPVAAGPDGIAIAAQDGAVFVSGSSTRTVSVIDSASDRFTQAALHHVKLAQRDLRCGVGRLSRD